MTLSLTASLTTDEWLKLAAVLVPAAALVVGIWGRARDRKVQEQDRRRIESGLKLDATQKYLLTFVASIETPGASVASTGPTEHVRVDLPLIGDALLYEEWLVAIVAGLGGRRDSDRLDALKRRLNAAFDAQRTLALRNQEPRRTKFDTARIRELETEFKRLIAERRARPHQDSAGDFGLGP
jgi:hypothetical protein